ncbi:phosphotransferase [Gemella bergeri]|nr:phosphotransferase [Gemella bergeri]
MLTLSEFNILTQLLNKTTHTQRMLAEQTRMSLGKVNILLKKLKDENLITENLTLTKSGLQSLEPFAVNNAIILAAGMSTRFAPLSYEKPKGLLKVKGELLIERQIEQLKAVGIKDIILVVGYMKEKMFYLEEKYGVKIVVNEEYYKYNNTSSLMLVKDLLANTYICSSDNYFVKNPFERYVYRSYYSAVYEDGETNEYCIQCDKKGKITNVEIGGENSWTMLGHVFFNKSFSEKFVDILEKEYPRQVTKNGLWEDLYIRYVSELDMYIRHYDKEQIQEFDSLDELREFDSNYLSNSNSEILKNICNVLNCNEHDIKKIEPIKSGMTNTSFKFSVDNKNYVYRHPGRGTDSYISRASEAQSMQVAKCLGIDDTYIYIDKDKGWKISYFIENARTLDYNNKNDVEMALNYLKKLHKSGYKTDYTFDIWKQIDNFKHILAENKRDDFEDMHILVGIVEKLKSVLNNKEICLCHCDSYDPNFLIDNDEKMYLIDWEYSGMADPAVDLGTFIACSSYTIDEAKQIIKQYLGEKFNKNYEKHYLGYTAVISFYWFLWALHQESVGKNVGNYLYIWYKYVKLYGKEALLTN